MMERKLRILLVSSSSGSLGGGEQYLVSLGGALASLGHRVETVLSNHHRMDGLAARCADFGSVTRVPYRNTYDRILRCVGAVLAWRTIRQMTECFRSASPDLIHINKQNVEDGLDLLLAAKRSRIPTLATIHNTRSMVELHSKAGAIRDWIASSVLARCPCHYIGVASSCAQQILNYGKKAILAHRVHTVWNGVYPVSVGDRLKVRAEWGCQDGQIVLGCVARLEGEKDPLFALDLLRQMPPHVHLAWVGDGRLRVEFLSRIQELGLTPRVHFDGWRNDARDRLAGLDVFVMPSLYEGFPLALLEAMSAGLPCVVSDVDGTREAVVEGATGWLCTPKDSTTWLAKLGGLVANEALRKQMGQKGRERIEQNFSLEAMAKGTVRVYEKVLASHGT